MAQETEKEIFDALNHQAIMPQLQGENAKQVTAAYSDMFNAMTYMHLLGGKPLGQAWYDAIKQMESFIKTKDKKNSVTDYMNKILVQHRKQLAEKMMTDPNREKIIRITPQQRQQITEQMQAKMNNAMQKINQMIEKYREIAQKLKEQIAQQIAQRAEKLAKDAEKARKSRQSRGQKMPPQMSVPAPEKSQPTSAPTMARPPRPNTMARPPQMNTQHRDTPAQTKTQPQVTPQTKAQQLSLAQQRIRALQAQRGRMQNFINFFQNQKTL